MQMSIGDSVYTTSPQVRFAVFYPGVGFGQLVVDVAPGETKAVSLPPNGKVITVHRPLLTDDAAPR